LCGVVKLAFIRRTLRLNCGLSLAVASWLQKNNFLSFMGIELVSFDTATLSVLEKASMNCSTLLHKLINLVKTWHLFRFLLPHFKKTLAQLEFNGVNLVLGDA